MSGNSPPRAWTPDRLWHAFATLHPDKVKRVSGKRLLSDLVSLVGTRWSMILC